MKQENGKKNVKTNAKKTSNSKKNIQSTKAPKRKSINIKNIIVLVVIIFLVLIIRQVIFNFYLNNQKSCIRILFNNEFLSYSDPVYIEDSVIYVSENDIKNIFDPNIYYNLSENELITTYNMHVAVLHLNENKILINDSEVEIDGNLKEFASKIYLPLTDLKIVYDLEINYSEKNNIIILDSTNMAKTKVFAIDSTKLKKKIGILSLNTAKVSAGDELYVVSNEGKYKKVRTVNGDIGYIKNKKVSDEEILRENLEKNEKEIEVFESSEKTTSSLGNLDVSKDYYEVINWFSLNKDNEISVFNDYKSGEYILYKDLLEGHAVKIVAQLTNDTLISSSLITYEQRSKIINELYNYVMESGISGIAINFEKIDDLNSFYRFVIELTPKFHESGIKVFVKDNGNIKKSKIKNIVDFIY